MKRLFANQKNPQIIKHSSGIHGSLFPLKDAIVHKTNVIYKGIYTCKGFYIGETKHTTEVRCNEHCSLEKSSEVGGHHLVNPDHNITWKIIAKA